MPAGGRRSASRRRRWSPTAWSSSPRPAIAATSSYQLADSTTFESYAASSITDPGNAEGVITVGATHRHWPHTYGVSFFSSRGPTGDGRLKPDLLAPGEKIASCVPGRTRQDQMDGTSMAAPHVSGAAALLMAPPQGAQGPAARGSSRSSARPPPISIASAASRATAWSTSCAPSNRSEGASRDAVRIPARLQGRLLPDPRRHRRGAGPHPRRRRPGGHLRAAPAASD